MALRLLYSVAAVTATAAAAAAAAEFAALEHKKLSDKLAKRRASGHQRP